MSAGDVAQLDVAAVARFNVGGRHIADDGEDGHDSGGRHCQDGDRYAEDHREGDVERPPVEHGPTLARVGRRRRGAGLGEGETLR